jgi:hypothetical protein
LEQAFLPTSCHERVETTMIYTQVMRQGAAGVPGPVGLLPDAPTEYIQFAVAATNQLNRESRRAALAQPTCCYLSIINATTPIANGVFNGWVPLQQTQQNP